MISLRRTTSEDPDFQALVRLLDADLAEKNGDQDAFYSQFNKIAAIRHVVVCYADATPVGCGAFKELSPGVAEIKRMFVQPDRRGQGIGGKVLRELEHWAAESGYQECWLETGKKQGAALHLYGKMGYAVMPNYGQYAGVENSVCMRKDFINWV
jgi:GNAT superfamily N-acetyltransferase